MQSNASVTLIPGTFPPGYCYPTDPQRFLLDICKKINAFLPGSYSTFVLGSTTPIAEDRGKPWIKLGSDGEFLGVYTYSNGQWVTQTIFTTGDIMMFSGSPNDVVAPWYLCNGENGTPDLRGKFILGWSDARPVGTTGGEEEHTLTIAEMPAHDHSGGAGVSVSGSDAGSNGNLANGWRTGFTGGGLAHNNMPPYYALAFKMYKES